MKQVVTWCYRGQPSARTCHSCSEGMERRKRAHWKARKAAGSLSGAADRFHRRALSAALYFRRSACPKSVIRSEASRVFLRRELKCRECPPDLLSLCTHPPGTSPADLPSSRLI